MKAARKSKEQKAIDRRVNAACSAAISGNVINIMDVLKVDSEGHRLVAAGADDAELRAALAVFVKGIAVA